MMSERIEVEWNLPEWNYTDMTIFNTQPTCGEISCDQCNKRYEKAMERIAALEDVVRELTGWGDYDLTVIKKCNYDWGAMRDKALKLVNGGK